MMYIIFIVDHIHHLINESKMLIFIYNSDRMVYKKITSSVSLVQYKVLHKLSLISIFRKCESFRCIKI